MEDLAGRVTYEVIIRVKGQKKELAKITLESVNGDEHFGDYSVRFGVHKGRGFGIHQRGIYNFPHKTYNVLALLLQALNTLDEPELRMMLGELE